MGITKSLTTIKPGIDPTASPNSHRHQRVIPSSLGWAVPHWILFDPKVALRMDVSDKAKAKLASAGKKGMGSSPQLIKAPESCYK